MSTKLPTAPSPSTIPTVNDATFHPSTNGSLHPPLPPPPPQPRNSAAPKRINPDFLPKRNLNNKSESVLDSIEYALEAFGRGEFLVVVDDEGRENEGDLIIAASECSTEKMAWMIRYTRYARVLLF